MTKVTFLGRAYPRAAHVSVEGPVYFQTFLGVIDREVSFRVDIRQSDITVSGEVRDYEPAMMMVVHNRAYDLARGLLDLAGFLQGRGFSMQFHFLQLDDGEPSPIDYVNPDLPALLTILGDEDAFDKVARGPLSKPEVFGALNDLVLGLSQLHHSTVNCARATESIRHIFQADGERDEDGWRRMRAALRFDRSYLDLIVKTSRQQRHGKRAWVSGDIATEVIRRSWVVMDRYLAYAIGGEVPLDPVKYPVLS